MLPRRQEGADRPRCLGEAKAFRDLFRGPARRPRQRQPMPRARSLHLHDGESDAGLPESPPSLGPALVLVPAHVIEQWDELPRETIAVPASPLVPEPVAAAAAPFPSAPSELPPIAPSVAAVEPPQPAVAAASRESSFRPARVVEAGTFRITPAQLAADVDDIRSNGTPRGDQRNLETDFLRYLAHAERQHGL